MKFGIRVPSFKKRLAARTSWRRVVRHSLGLKAPRGWGWLTNPKRAAYNRVYNRTSISVGRLFRRRRGSHSRGLVFLVLLGLILLAAFGTYVLVVCVLGLVGWLIRIVTESSADPAPETVEASSPELPDARYLALTAVDPSVFNDPVRVGSAAREVFTAWLRQMASTPRSGADLVRTVEVRRRLIGRLVTGVEGRRFAWKTLPVTGRQVIEAPPLDPAALDPWNPPPDLARASRHVAVCGTCQGRGRIPCESCAGSGRTPCSTCSGTGKYQFETGDGSARLLNCGDCRGRGNTKCDRCIRGLVVCGTCGNARKLDCWLEVDESSRQDVQVEPRGSVEKVFAWGAGGPLAPTEALGRDGTIIESIEMRRPIVLADLPAEVPEAWRLANWQNIQAEIQPGESVQSQMFTLLEVPSTKVTYWVLGQQQSVTFEGLRMLAPPLWSEVVVARRATMLGRLKIVLAALPCAAIAIYVARGAYFARDRAGPLVAGVVAATAVTASCAYAVSWCATIGRRRSAVKWAFFAIAPIAAAAGLAVLAEPSESRARSYLDAGQLVRATAELEGLGSVAKSGSAALWADLHLKQALLAETCAVARTYVATIPDGTAQLAAASARADALALGAARQALEAGDLDKASKEIGCASDGAASEGRALRGQIALAEARRSIELEDWSGAFAKAGTARRLGWSWADEVWAQAIAALRAEVDAGIQAARAEKDARRRVAIETATLVLLKQYPQEEESAGYSHQVATLRAAKERDDKGLARKSGSRRRRPELAQ